MKQDGGDNIRLAEGETQKDYDRKRSEWVGYWKPANRVESELVEKVTAHNWLIDRVIRVQDGSITKSGGVPTPELIQMLRYQATQERAFLESMMSLQEIKEFGHQETLGFTSGKSNRTPKPKRDGNPWLNEDLDPFTECGWADPITGKFTPFGDGFASELLEDQEPEPDSAA